LRQSVIRAPAPAVGQVSVTKSVADPARLLVQDLPGGYHTSEKYYSNSKFETHELNYLNFARNSGEMNC
jgi:hypothetical protein